MCSLILSLALDFTAEMDNDCLLDLQTQAGNPALCENVDSVFSVRLERGFAIVHGCNVFVTSLDPESIVNTFVDQALHMIYILQSDLDKKSLRMHVFNGASGEFIGDPCLITTVDDPSVLPTFYIAGISVNKQIAIHCPAESSVIMLDLSRNLCERFDLSQQCRCVRLFSAKSKSILVASSASLVLIFDWKLKKLISKSTCKFEIDGISRNMIMTRNGTMRFAVYQNHMLNIFDVSLQTGSSSSKQISLACDNIATKSVNFLSETDFAMIHNGGILSCQLNYGECLESKRLNFMAENIEISGNYVHLYHSSGFISHIELSVGLQHFFVKCLQKTNTNPITAVCNYNDEFVLLGYSDGQIHLHPLDVFLSGRLPVAPLNRFFGHKTAVTSFLVPSLHSVEGEMDNDIEVFLSGDDCGNIMLYDLTISHPIHIFRAHTQPIKCIIQPLPESYVSVCKLPGNSKVATSADNEKRPEKIRQGGSLNLAPETNNSSRSSLSSVEVHSALHRLLMCVSRCFYAITSENVVVLLDWNQKRVGWILNGVLRPESILNCRFIIPDLNVLDILLSDNENLSAQDFNDDLMGNSVIIEIQTGTSSIYWLIYETGSILLCDRNGKNLIESGIELFKIPEKHVNPVNYTKYAAVSIESRPLWNLYMCHINIKHLLVLNSSTLEMKESEEKMLTCIVVGLLPNLPKETLNIFPTRVEDNSLEDALKLRIVTNYSEDRFVYGLEMIPVSEAFAKKSVRDTAAISLASMVLLKILEAKPGNEAYCGSFISYIFNDLYRHIERPWNLPSISWIAKYYNDPIPIVQECAKSFFRSILRKQTALDFENLFDTWYPCLSGIQSTEYVKLMWRACVILSALSYEESKKDVGNEEFFILGVTDCESRMDSALKGSAKLSPSSEQQLVLSLVTLLIQSQDTDAKGPKKSVFYQCIALDFLSLMWKEWKHIYDSLTENHISKLINRNVQSSLPLNTPLYCYILKKVWQIAAQSAKTSSDPEKILRRTRRRSIPLRKNNMSFAMTPKSDSISKIFSGEESSVSAVKIHRSRSKHGLNSINVVPMVRKEFQLMYDEEITPSPRYLINCSRNSIVKIARQDPVCYVHTLCTELLNAGLGDGEWERVRILLKSGIGVIIKNAPIVFFPTFLPYVIETMIKACLDPVIPFSIREGLSSTLSPILQQIIQTYPTVSFHARSQKLCIGTGNDGMDMPESVKEHIQLPGLLIIWDLKTATRVQIIHAHKSSSVSAVSFNMSTDKDDTEPLLASYSHEEGFVKFYQHAGLFNSIAIGIKNTFLQRPTDESGGIFHNLAGAGQLRLFREFKVDEMNESNRSLLSYHRSRKSSIAAIHILQQVRLSWENDRSVKLKRPDPLPALTFTV